ncbi:hypothetical protein [uncultured Chryseobacterium sp.]|nr:hypothetical protein [uncultured Chryseobacterium sp.]
MKCFLTAHALEEAGVIRAILIPEEEARISNQSLNNRKIPARK